MAANSFISARIPSEILEQLEHYSEVTGNSKSKVIVKALVSFLDNLNKLEYETSITGTEKRIRTIENYINERFKSLEAQLEKLDKDERIRTIENYINDRFKSLETQVEKLDKDERIRTIENYINERFKSLEAQFEKLDKEVFHIKSTSDSVKD